MSRNQLNAALEALHPKVAWLRWAAPRARCAWAAIRRRPRASLYTAVVAVVVLPLVPDLFFAIPWPYRKALGFAAFLAVACVCLGRLLLVRDGDDLPPADDVRSPRLLTLALPLACGALAVPLLKHPENLGYFDWDLNLQKYESVRRTIALWGEFPWWDPWCRGGFPLAANPQCGVVGVATPLVLAFGTSVGLRLATLACLLIAAEGSRRLALMWIADPQAAVAAGLVYALNGGVLPQVVSGYHLQMSYLTFPWILYYLFRLERRAADGLWLGFWLAFSLLNGINYYTVYAAMIGAVVWLRAARVRSGTARVRFLSHTALALGTFLALAGWRVATTGWVYRDFPRHLRWYYDQTIWTFGHLTDRPAVSEFDWLNVQSLEAMLYLGPVVVGLGLASLAWGWRWWHTLALLCGWLAAGSVSWDHPSYWLSDLPLFSTMHWVSRWRIMAVLGIALSVADILARLRASPRPALRALAAGAILVIAADYVALGYEILPIAFSVAPTADRFPGPPTTAIVQVEYALGFPSVLRGYGVVRGYEPLIGYDRWVPTARLWRGHPAYVGESWTARGPVRPVAWSPNRIVFHVAPHEEVTVNQNPGSWWLANGVMPGARCAETLRPFAARADARGVLDLRIRPRGLGLGLGLHLAGLALMILAWAGARATSAAEWREVIRT